MKLRWFAWCAAVAGLTVLTGLSWGMTGADASRDQMIYTTNSDSDSVSIIDRKTRKVVRTFPVGDYPHHVLHSPDGKFLYASSRK